MRNWLSKYHIYVFGILCVLILAAALSSCTSVQTSPKQQLLQACEGWVDTKITLTTAVLANKITDFTLIKAVVPMVDSVCNGPEPDSDAAAQASLTTIQTAIQQATVVLGSK